MYQPSRLLTAILALAFVTLSVHSLQAATVDEALDLLADLNDQTVKAANLVNQIYEFGLPRMFEKIQKIVEHANAGFVSSEFLEELTRDALADSSLIADLQLKQLTSLVALMRTDQTNFVGKLKESATQKSIGRRRANKLLRRAADVSFLIDQFEQQVNGAASKLESMDALLSGIVASLSGQGSAGTATMADLPQALNKIRLAYKDRLVLRETLRTLIKLVLQKSQDLREAQRLSRRVGRLSALSSPNNNQRVTLYVMDLSGQLRAQMYQDTAQAALSLAEAELANGVYLLLLTSVDEAGHQRQQTLNKWVIRH
jgi:hypothetical protein